MTDKEINQMVQDNLRLVTFTVNKYYHQYLSDDDIMQLGYIGLWNAIKSYNPDRGKFSGYASVCIKHEIDKHFQGLNTKMRKADVCSLDGFVTNTYLFGGEQEVGPHEVICGDPDVNWFDSEDLLNRLDKKDRFILIRICKGYTQQEIADAIGCTIQNVNIRMKNIRYVVRKVLGLKRTSP